jgi:two-component system NtrC family sensor kinase
VRLPAASPSAIGLLRVLLACSVLLPAAWFCVACWLNYQGAFANAEQALLHSTEVAREQAAKVFDGQSQVADRVQDLVAGMDVAAIKAAEQPLHEAFAGIVARLPQVQSVLIADREGHPLVSAGTYPVPEISVAERDYFKAIVDGYRGTFVSAVQVGAINRMRFFGLSRAWTAPDGTLLGVVDVAVLPAFFEDFYKVLVGEGGDTRHKLVALLRDDGQVLARYPPIQGRSPRLAVNSAFRTAIRAHPVSGVYHGQSVIDVNSGTRLFAYRKVEGYPLYVLAGRDRRSVIAEWWRTMASHLVFGVPATLALFAVTWTALVRTRREADALARARQEIVRREDAEAALLRAQRLEAVGQLTGGVAHDFNNLLTVILGSAEVLRKRADDPQRVRAVAEQITLAAKRGGEVTQQLLAFSRRQVVKPELLDLNALLRAFQPLLVRAAREAAAVELALDPALGAVRLDPGHFEAAILNLVGNARDAMPGGGRIVITTGTVVLAAGATELPAGRYVRVAVSDDGTGMDAATAAKAFEPFFTTKGVGKGTGLGLSQVYGFAKQAGGDVRITTAPGAGTTVELLLPQTEQPAPPARGAGGVADGCGAQGEVVLVVEDEPGVLDMTVDSLRELGYATVTATTAQAALQRLRELDRVDLLFSDVTMPGGMSGLQLSVEARRLRPDLKVLLTSGFVGDFDDAQDIPLLTKPYDRGQLATQVRAVLQA